MVDWKISRPEHLIGLDITIIAVHIPDDKYHYYIIKHKRGLSYRDSPRYFASCYFAAAFRI